MITTKVNKNINRQILKSEIKNFESTFYHKLNEKEKDVLNFLNEKINNDTVNFAVIGQFKRGKSTFINALLGIDILPTGVIPLTSVITLIKYSDNLFAMAFFNDGNYSQIDISELKSYIAESENPNNIKNVKYIEIGYPNKLLKQGLMFIDTPGIGSLHLNNTISTYEYLPKIDAAIFVTSSDPAISETEMDLLSEILNITNNIIFILNKIDYLNNSELREVISYTRNQIRSRIYDKDFSIFPISSKFALGAKISKDEHLLEKSGLENFEEYLVKYFYNEKENILIDSVKRQILNLIKEVEMGLEIEVKSLLLSKDELEQKHKLLVENLNYLSEDDLTILNKAKNNIKVLLSDYCTKLNNLLPEINSRVKYELNNYEKENRILDKRKFKSGINKLFKEVIKKELESVRCKMEEEIKEKSKSIFQDTLNSYNSIINKIYKIVSKYFDINLKELHYEKKYEIPPSFEYITYEFKLLFNFNKSSFAFILPKSIHNKIITNKTIERTEFIINYNSAYITESIQKRLERKLIEYNIVLRNEINVTIKKIKDIIQEVRILKEKKDWIDDRIINEVKEEIFKINRIKVNLKKDN